MGIESSNIEKAANYYDVNPAETPWHDLGTTLKRIEERLPPEAL
jgi:hypothetical protein